MGQRGRRSGLFRFFATLVILVAVCFAVARVYSWFTSRSVGAAIEASGAKIDQANALIAEGKTNEAKELLQAVAEHGQAGSIVPKSLVLLASIADKEGDRDKAIALLDRAVNEFPQSPDHPNAGLQFARLLIETGQADKARPVLEQIEKSAPPAIRAPAVTLLANLTRQDKTVAAQEKAREMYRAAIRDAEWKSPAWDEALDGLGNVNVDLLFSREPTSESEYYAVEKGDSITLIGNKKNITQGMLTRGNGISEDTNLQIGQRLKYTPKDFRIIIERSTCNLYVLDNKGLFKRYSTGLGMPGHETTLGSYKIGNKEKEPTWHKPGEGPIPYGDERNELGTRWMPLVPVQESLPKDLGIHGTKRPETIGSYASNGCARLLNDEVEELYDLVVRSTPVDIVEAITPETIQPK
jgi:lipoprotein-anchoring transpeptidase ErfK/SrfK